VLVDECDRMVGTMPKQLVHSSLTPLHRAFSCFAFRLDDRQLLLQQRSRRKPTWPLIWSNSCCGHPGPGESRLQACRRRLQQELGLAATLLEQVAPYRYCFSRAGIKENEICPIFVALVEGEPLIDSDEVEAVRWVPWEGFLEETEADPGRYSEWCVEEAQILVRSPRFRQLVTGG